MLDLVFLAGLAAALIAVAVIDARTQRIPDALNAVIAAGGLLRAGLEGALASAVIGLVLGYALIWGVNALYRARRGRDGVGMGDAKLLAAGGAWVGWLGAPFVVLVASSAALAYLAVQRLRGRTIGPTTRIAFGPFLAAGIGVVAVILALA